MIHATGYVPTGGSKAGIILYTHPSGMTSTIKDLNFVEYGTTYNVKVIEIYPSGQNMSLSANSVKTGVIFETKSSNTNLHNINIAAKKYSSKIGITASGNLMVYCDYILRGKGLKQTPGYYSWNSPRNG